MQKQWIVKKATQPLGHQSAGCIFKNPRGMSAGMLIEQAGLEGITRSARPKSATATPTSSSPTPAPRSQDVLKLIDLVRERVHRSAGHRARNGNRSLVEVAAADSGHSAAEWQVRQGGRVPMTSRDDRPPLVHRRCLPAADSAEREVSLRSGAAVAAALVRCRSRGDADRSGRVRVGSMTSTGAPFDACFIALHGGAGEDGRVQQRARAAGRALHRQRPGRPAGWP